MKNFRYIVPFLLFLPACQREGSPVSPVPELVEHTLYASTPGEEAPQTRTQISVLDDKKVLWTAHENISILSGGGNYQFQGDNDAPAAAANFTGTGPANLGSYIALYPYNASAIYDAGYVSTTLPSVQLGKAGSFFDGYLVTADDATGDNISFNHLCSGLRFMVNRDDITAVSIRGNSGEKIAGDFRFRFAAEDTPVAEAGTEECVILRPSSGSAFEAGKYYYIIILPTVFSKGFTLMADNGSQVGELRFDTEVAFTAGKFKNITGNLDGRMAWAAPSSQVYYGQENSVCIRPGETISFDVNPRKIYGTWQRSGLPASAPVPDEAEVLWGGGSISEASVSIDGKLTVTASNTPGSALVAVKKNGTILWSYLIWVTESAPSGDVLPPLGGQLYFQWGRKDPLTASSVYAGNQGTGGLSYSISHPCDFIGNSESANGYDWFTENADGQDDALWGEGGGKTVWDPCPSGYRVPSRSDSVSGSSDNYGYLTHIGDILYVYGGNMCWTRDTFIGSIPPHQSYYTPYTPPGTGYRYIAYPVRCIKE